VTALSLVATHSAAAWAQSRAAESSLPIGTPIAIVSDETVKPGVRPGSQFRAHLRDPIELGTTLVAPAGTAAHLIVVSTETGIGGTPAYRIAIVDLNLGLAGILPVRPQSPIVAAIVAGMTIPASTLAAIALEAGKVRVEVPLPFPLSNEPPAANYTPAPLRTANPSFNQPRSRRRSGPSPSPSPTTAPGVPAPNVTASPAPNVTASSAPNVTPNPPAGVGPNPMQTAPPPGTPVFPTPTPPGMPGAGVPTPIPLPT
jgi:hypothetical protein